MVETGGRERAEGREKKSLGAGGVLDVGHKFLPLLGLGELSGIGGCRRSASEPTPERPRIHPKAPPFRPRYIFADLPSSSWIRADGSIEHIPTDVKRKILRDHLFLTA